MDRAQFPAIINLNVGGRNFTTHLSTLTKDPKSKLAAIFSGRHSILTKDQDGRYFINVDGDMFAHVLNYLRFEKLPPADAAVDMYEYAVYFGIQSLVEEMKVFESVIHHVYLEKIKAFYPNYREYLAKIAEKIANVNNSMPIHNYDKLELKIHIFDETKCSRNQWNLYYRPHHEDKDGKHLMNLIQAELYKRGSYVDISKTNVDYFELRLNSTNQFSQAHKTDEKMLNVLHQVAANTKRIR